MSEPGSISVWIELLKNGDANAAQSLWERYYRRLVGLARKKLGNLPRRAIDEEDIVQSAFNSFFQGAGQGRFPKLNDRDDLWRLLVVITAHKAHNQRVHQQCAKRGGGKVMDEAGLGGFRATDGELTQIVGAEPSPEFAAQIVEQLGSVMDSLPDPTHRVIALWKLESRTNPEIARHLDCSVSAVERKLRLIREQLESMLSSQEVSDLDE